MKAVDVQFKMTERKKEMLEKSWAKDFAERLFPIIDERIFSPLYGKKASSPNESVKVMVGALVLKELLGMADAELLESAMLDLRFSYALHAADIEEYLLNEKELSSFRLRCHTHEIMTGKDLIRECVMELSKEMENLTKKYSKMIPLEAPKVASNIKNLSRLEFLYTCVSNLVAWIRSHGGEVLLSGYERYFDSAGYHEFIYHTHSDEIDLIREEVLKDAENLTILCDNGDYDMVSEYQLLIRVLLEEAVPAEKAPVSPKNKEHREHSQVIKEDKVSSITKELMDMLSLEEESLATPAESINTPTKINGLGRYGGYLKITAVLLTFTSAIAIAAAKLKPMEAGSFPSGQILYDASHDIKGAFDQLKNKDQKAQIATDVDTMKKVVAINFLGSSNSKTNDTALKLLSENGQKATFMVSGMTAAEDTDFILKIKEQGNEIGSSGLKGEKELENLSQEKLIENLAKANRILYQITGETPKLLQGTLPHSSKELLEAASACGFEYVVESRKYLNYQSFTSYEQALDYVKGLKWGSIVTIKMSGILNEAEYGKQVEEISTQEDGDNPIHEEAEKEKGNKSEEEHLIQVIGWLSKALKETGFQTAFAQEIPKYQDQDFAMDFSALREKNQGKLSPIYSSGSINGDIGLTFRGIGSKENLDKILLLLKENNRKATFFITGKELEECEDSVKEIIAQGHEIGNGGLTGKDLSDMDFSSICFEIYKNDKLLKEKYGVVTKLFMPVYAKYNDLVREAASALSYDVVTYTKNPMAAERSPEEIKAYFKKGIRKGEIVHFRLDVSDDVEEAVEYVLGYLGNKNYKVSFLQEMINNMHDTSRILPPASASSREAAGSAIDFNQVRVNNQGRKAETVYTVHSTSQELSFTFSGISRTEVLYDVLEKMDQIQGKGTFFVTEEEIAQNKEEIRQILNRGHEIGLCLTGKSGDSFKSVYQSLINMQEKLNKEFGVQPVLVRYPYDAQITSEMSEAIASAGCTVVWQDLSMANSKVGSDGTLEAVLSSSFHAGNISARRGYIVYFRMDYYNDKSLIGNLLLDVYKNRVQTISFEDGVENNGSQYRIVSVGQLRNSPGIYQYPVKEADYKTGVGDITPGHMAWFSEAEKFEIMKKRYVGNPDYSDENVLPGFSQGELKLIDITGRFTNEKVLFLTIDDWGSDKPINQILYVLRKYGVKASFHVRTNRIEENPNLLRSIAEEGHDIGTHTDGHLPYAIYDEIKSRREKRPFYNSLTSQVEAERMADLALSYKKLCSVVGDVSANGKPVLTKIFRPPTLAMSKNGMESIFDMGFEYIVSGDFSSHDYEAKTPRQLADELLKGIKRGDGSRYSLRNGSVMVLHMSDDSNVPSADPDITAKALDLVIPELINQGYRFDKVSNYLTKPLEKRATPAEAAVAETKIATASELNRDDKQDESSSQ